MKITGNTFSLTLQYLKVGDYCGFSLLNRGYYFGEILEVGEDCIRICCEGEFGNSYEVIISVKAIVVISQ